MPRYSALSKPMAVLCALGTVALAPQTIIQEVRVEQVRVEPMNAVADECANDWAGSIQQMTITGIRAEKDRTVFAVRPRDGGGTSTVHWLGPESREPAKGGRFTVTFLDSGCVDSIAPGWKR